MLIFFLQDGNFYLSDEQKPLLATDTSVGVERKTTQKTQRKQTLPQTKPRNISGQNNGQVGGGFGKYRFFCQECKKVFSQKVHWMDHQRQHDGTVLSCQFCPKTFASQRGLERHIPLHTGKFPFHCAQCNQGFNLRSQLVAHENQHLGRGYSCLNCSKVFYTEKDLFKHQDKCTVKTKL